jgi:ATP-dependent helicase/nuclease subunit A
MTSSSKQSNSILFASPEVRVVEASAGSGKTFALAKRYVQLLLRNSPAKGVPLRTILAITFTNKASLEMKARILEFLKKIALGRLSPIEHAEIVKPLDIPDEEASRRAFAAMEAVIRNYNFFQVQTIDSFINALLSGCSFKIHLSSNFKIRRNSREYVAASLDRLIDRALSDKEVRQVFNQFVHQYLFIENRTGWFPKKDLLNLMGTLFGQGNSFADDFVPVDLSGEDLFAKKKMILKAMASLKEVLPENTHAKFREKFLEFLDTHPDGFDIDSISDYFNREEFPSTKGNPLAKDVEELWKAIHRELKHLCEMEATSIFNPYIHVFGLMSDELRVLATKEDVLFLEQLNKKARSLFDEGLVTVEELYYRLATRFHHYMIDEFQDTSRLQWENLSMMVEEALSTGGSFFYVGDKKQAIYSFRGGDSRLFDQVKESFAAFGVREEALQNNYRSRRNIVEFNNTIFSRENLERLILLKEEGNKKDAVFFGHDDLADLHHMFANTRQTPREGFDGGLVRVEFLDGDKKEDRDDITRQKLVGLVNEIRGRFALRDIAILARNNSDVEAMTGWFLEAGIPVESERTSNIQANPVIAELLALLRFLDSPIDNVSFADFILGDVFTRASGLKSTELSEFVFSLRAKTSKDTTFYIYKEFRDRYPVLWDDIFDHFFRNVGLYPLYELTVNVIDRLKIPENFPDVQGFVMHFLEIIKRQEKEHGDLTGFLEYFEDPLPEDLFVNVTDHDSLRILTIHKAKGLEFPVVILPSLEMEVKVGSGGRDGQQSFIVHHADDGIHLLRLKDKYRHFSPQLRDIYQAEYKRAFLSELNNVYVALTRAVHELHVFVPSKAGNSQNMARLLVPEECRAVGEAVTDTKARSAGAGRLKLSFAAHKDWLGFLKEEFLDVTASRRDLRRRGEAMHFLLSFVGGDISRPHLDEAMTLARREGRLAFPFITDWAELEDDLRALIQEPKLRPFFNVGKHDKVLCELEVIDSFGETKRIDRLIDGEDGVDIIDFKSSKEAQEDHRRQVEGYIQLVADLYPGQSVRGWLVYLNDRSLEAVAKS